MWVESNGWNSKDISKVVRSSEVLPEDLQDFTVPMVIVGGDVVSLYPNMKVKIVSGRVMEAILKSPVIWREVDYLEAVRYIALNLSADECIQSGLRRRHLGGENTLGPSLQYEVRDQKGGSGGTRNNGSSLR